MTINAAKAAAEATAAALDDAIQVGGRNWLKDSQTITLSGSDRPHTRTTVFDNGITTLTVIDAASALSAYDWIQGYLTDDSIADSHAPTHLLLAFRSKLMPQGLSLVLMLEALHISIESIPQYTLFPTQRGNGCE